MDIKFLLCLFLAEFFSQAIAQDNSLSTYSTESRNGQSTYAITNSTTSTGYLATTVSLALPVSPTLPMFDLGRPNSLTAPTKTSITEWFDLGKRPTSKPTAYDLITRSTSWGPTTSRVPLSGESSHTLTTLDVNDPFPYSLSLTEPITKPVIYKTSTLDPTTSSVPSPQFGSSIATFANDITSTNFDTSTQLLQSLTSTATSTSTTLGKRLRPATEI